MKYVFGFLLFVVLSVGAYGQIDLEIKSYTDSTGLYVSNGRNMILHELENDNLQKVKEVYDYLSDLTKNKPYAAFYYVEDFYINMLTSDWDAVEKLIVDYEDVKDKTIYPDSPVLVNNLFKVTVEDTDQILSDCNNSQIDEEAKRLVALLVYYMKEERSDNEYNDMLSAYKKDFDNPDYKDFEDGFLPKKILKGSFAYSFGSGVQLATKDLANNFSNAATFNMSMDINVGRVYSSLYMTISTHKLQVPFTVVSEYESIDFIVGDKFNFFMGGLKGGYFVVRNDWFHLAPYAVVSGGYLESMLYSDPDDNDLEYEIFNSFIYGAGLHTEFKFYEYDYPNYGYGIANGYFSLKLDAGYNKILRFSDDYCIGDAPYVSCGIVMGFGDF